MLAAPAVASAAAPRTFQELASLIVLILDNATAVLIVAGIVIYFWGISTNILKLSDEGGAKLKLYLFWGIIVLFVMVSIWGILRLLQSTIFGSSAYSQSSELTESRSPDLFQPPVFSE
ncbi:MAG: hypothetical protein Q7S50_00315 [bacterium]|nr:hypothetical protein [bacterium]